MNEMNETFQFFDLIKEDAQIYGMLLIGLLGTVTGMIIGSGMIKKDIKTNKDSELNQELHHFYYPMQLLLKTTNELHKLLSGTWDNQDVILALLEGKQIKDNDRLILDHIISVNGEIEKLISNSRTLINDSNINQLLAKALAHYKLLPLVVHGKIKGESYRFKQNVYPKDLNTKINQKIEELESKLRIRKFRQLRLFWKKISSTDDV